MIDTTYSPLTASEVDEIRLVGPLNLLKKLEYSNDQCPICEGLEPGKWKNHPCNTEGEGHSNASCTMAWSIIEAGGGCKFSDRIISLELAL